MIDQTQARGEGDPILWAKAPWTGRAVLRARCQNEQRGVGWLKPNAINIGNAGKLLINAQ